MTYPYFNHKLGVPKNKHFYGVTQERIDHIENHALTMTERKETPTVSYKIDYSGLARGQYRVREMPEPLAVGQLLCDLVNALDEIKVAYELTVGYPYRVHDAFDRMPSSKRELFHATLDEIWKKP